MPTLEEIHHAVKVHLDRGEHEKAEEILVRLLVQEPQNSAYWLMLSQVVGGEEQRKDCLTQALRFDPGNQQAAAGLVALGVDPKSVKPATTPPPAAEAPPLPPSSRRPLVVAVSAAVLLVAAGLLINSLAKPASAAGRNSSKSYVPISTATTAPTDVPTATPLPPGPTPPWAVLPQAYTPTPLYGRTPHPVLEAYQLAVDAFEKKNFVEAARYFSQSAESDPASADAAYWLGESYRLLGRWEPAFEAYDAAVTRDDAYALGWLGRARARLQLDAGDLEAAEQDLETAIQTDEQLGEAYLELANLYLISGRAGRAFHPLERADQLLPGTPLTSLARAEAYRQLGQVTPALNEVERALEADLALVPAYRLKGRLLVAAEDFAAAVAPLEIYLRYGPDGDSEALAWLGASFLGLEQPHEALAVLARAAALESYPAETYLLIGRAYLSLDQERDAIAAFKRGVEDNPGSFGTLQLLADTQLQAGQARDAADSFSLLLRLAEDDPQRAAALLGRARSLMSYQPAKAVDVWRALLALPEDVLSAEQAAEARSALASLLP